jgi:hypothetical protein
MRPHHILDASANLLGVSLIIVTAVHITGKAGQTIADELSFAGAILFIAACAFSHRAIAREDDRFERIADKIFVTGLLLLLCGVLSFWF